MQNKMWMRYLEAIVLTGILLLLLSIFSPADPLLLYASFPWVWFIPVLIGLRHGRVAALLSDALIVIVLVYTMSKGYFTWNDYRIWLLGGITLSVICGEYQAFWLRRLFQLIRKESYLAKRIEALSIAYGVMKLSHDRLEEALIIKPTTLREAFIDLQNLLKNARGEFTQEIINRFLEILTFYTGADKLGLHILEGRGKSIKLSVALRDNEPLNLEDPLVKNCLKNKVASYYAINMLDENQNSEYLAVLPMKTSEEKLLGILTIKEMSFLALNEESLKTLSLLLSYFADEEWAAKESHKLQKVYPDCPVEFSSEAFKLEHVWHLAKIDTAIAAFYFEPHPKREDLYYLIKAQKRALDIIWETEKGDTKILIFLMPLTERSMFTGYLNRIRSLIKEDSQLNLGDKPIMLRHYQLSGYQHIVPLLEDVFK